MIQRSSGIHEFQVIKNSPDLTIIRPVIIGMKTLIREI
jgi:hypothetical protein